MESKSNPDNAVRRYWVIMLLLLECVYTEFVPYLQRLWGSLAAWDPVACPGALDLIPSCNSAVGRGKKKKLRLTIENSEDRFLVICCFYKRCKRLLMAYGGFGNQHTSILLPHTHTQREIYAQRQKYNKGRDLM